MTGHKLTRPQYITLKLAIDGQLGYSVGAGRYDKTGYKLRDGRTRHTQEERRAVASAGWKLYELGYVTRPKIGIGDWSLKNVAATDDGRRAFEQAEEPERKLTKKQKHALDALAEVGWIRVPPLNPQRNSVLHRVGLSSSQLTDLDESGLVQVEKWDDDKSWGDEIVWPAGQPRPEVEPDPVVITVPWKVVEHAKEQPSGDRWKNSLASLLFEELERTGR